MRQFFKYALPGFLLLSIIIACDKEYETIDVIDDRNVTAYIQQNKLNMKEYEDTGVYYEVVSPGTGTEVQYSDRVPLIFTTRSLDGKYMATDTFGVGNRDYRYLGYFNPEAIRVGIKEVLKNRSGTLRMIIPSRLAYGRNGVGDIPGNASLDFVVKVLDTAKMAAYDDFTINKYLNANGLTGFTKTTSGLYYKIAAPGTGSPITIDSTVVTQYTGKLLNGVVFDRAVTGSEATFTLSDEDLRKGWKEAIPLIREGGSIRFIMPSSLGYGLEGSSGVIPPFSCLDFAVKVTDVKQ